MGYTLQNIQSKAPRLKEMLSQQMAFILQKNVQAVVHLEAQLKLYNPALKSKEGWGEVLIDGKRQALKSLKKDDIFVLQDVNVSIKAKVISSASLM